MVSAQVVSAQTTAAIRFGFGFAAGESPPDGPEALLAGLSHAAALPSFVPLLSEAERHDLITRMLAARDAGEKEKTQELRQEIHRGAQRDVGARLLQRAIGPSGFLERLTEFWLDHFTIAARVGTVQFYMALFESEAIRPHIAGRFADMLVAVLQHPAMLYYLDQPFSFGPESPRGRKRGRGLNENLAREVLELHTLGASGPYTQHDVREFAKLLTGYTTRQRYRSFRFEPGRAEPGVETVLGQSYGGGEPDPGEVVNLLHDLARHPATARHLARKLAVHFVADDPDPGLVAHVAAAWEASGGDLPAVYAALVEHPAAWQGFGAKVKRPLDLMVSSLRAGGTDRAMAERMLPDGAGLAWRLGRLGQPLYRTPGPDGWPERAEAWITPQGLAARIDYASAEGRRLVGRRIHPRTLARGALGDALRAETAIAAATASERSEGIALVIASPEFNRR